MKAHFDNSMDRLMVLEGHKFTNDPNDAGGPTKFGVSKLAYPDEDIEQLTYGRAKELYRADFWLPIGGDDIEDEEICFQLFEHAVHSDPPRRPRRAVRSAQLGLIILDQIVTFDGVMGPRTTLAINSCAYPAVLLKLMNGFQYSQLVVGAKGELEFYDMVFDRLSQLRAYLRGWLRRIEVAKTV